VSSIVEPDIPRDIGPEAIRRNTTYIDTVETIWQGLKQYLD
jgi:NitT/TauT family transport system ATP-binding protein